MANSSVRPSSKPSLRRLPVRFDKRYAVAGARSLAGGQIRVRYDDEAMRQFGPNVYDRMARDPVIRAGTERTVVSIAGQPVTLRTRVPEDKTRRHKLGVEVAAFCERAWSRLRERHDTLEAMLREGMKWGDKAAEISLEPGSGEDARRWTLESWAAVDRRATVYALDDYGRCLGLVGHRLGAGLLRIGDLAFRDAEIIPRAKFTILTLRGNGTSPIGESLYLPLVATWNIKQLTLPERVRFMRKCAAPHIVAKTAKNAPSEQPIGADGLPIADAAPVPASVAMAQKAAQLENFGVIGIDGEASVTTLDVTGDATVFDSLIDWCDRQNLVGLVLSSLGMVEANKGTRAQAIVHDFQSDLFTAWLTRKAEAMLEDIFRLLVAVNWPDSEDLVPIVSLGDTERKDWAAVAKAIVPLIELLIRLGYQQAVDDLIASIGLPTVRDDLVAAKEAAEEKAKAAARGGEES